MKNKQSIFFAAILIGLCVVLLLIRYRSPHNGPVVASSVTNVATTVLAKQSPTQSVKQSAASTVPQNVNTQQVAKAAQTMKELMDQEYNHPFLFYGKVVDQSNAPVQGATANFNWATLSGDEQYASSVSDDQGLFSLEKGKGYKLQMSVSKAGYYTPKNENLTTIAYGDELGHETFQANIASPVVFHLRKKGSGVELIRNLQLFGFRTNGPVQYLDLVEDKNRLTPPGDLAVQFTRGEKNAEGKYDWSVVISVPDGGIYETNEEFMFLAPEEGYQPSVEIHYDANDSDWLSQLKERFYFTSRNESIYGWAEATILPSYQGGAAIDLSYYINPSGSRDLEPIQ